MRLYKPYIERARRVARTMIRPMNIYRIVLYRTVDDDLRRHVGEEHVFVFVIGVYDGKVNCLKISELNPMMFFTWLKNLVRVRSSAAIDKSNRLDEIMVREADRSGMSIFNRYVKNSPIVYDNQRNPIYRTYVVTGIKYGMEITLKKSILKAFYG